MPPDIRNSVNQRWELVPYHFAPVPDDWDLLRLKLSLGSAVNAQAFATPVLVKTRRRVKYRGLLRKSYAAV